MNLFALVPAPYRLLAIALLALACTGFGYVKGVRHQQGVDAVASASAEKAAHDAYVAQTEKLNAAAQALEVAKNEKEIVYRTITQTVDRIVDRPVYRNVCLDADGLRNINAAAAGRAADPGQPDAAVPAAGAADRHDGR
jgi:hypothetical protein